MGGNLDRVPDAMLTCTKTVRAGLHYLGMSLTITSCRPCRELFLTYIACKVEPVTQGYYMILITLAIMLYMTCITDLKVVT